MWVNKIVGMQNGPYLVIIVLVRITIGKRVNLNFVLFYVSQNFLLQRLGFVNGEKVGFGNQWNDIDFVLDQFEELNIRRLETVRVRRDEVETAMDSSVAHLTTIQSRFVAQIPFKLFVNVVDDWLSVL